MKKPKLEFLEAGHIAHHVNNPLAIIIGQAQLLKRIGSENEKELEVIIGQAKRIADYVKSLQPEESEK